jgi:uncharacterized protein (DUF1810 family)
MADVFNLQRFVDAQDSGGTYASAVEELRNGAKRSHWMWFVFPQIAGLGHSAMARRYAVGDLKEAQAYLEHPVLGARLKVCTAILTQLAASNPIEIFGVIDAQKLKSSMTLFARADPTADAFREVLDLYFDGEFDTETDRRLERQ